MQEFQVMNTRIWFQGIMTALSLSTKGAKITKVEDSSIIQNRIQMDKKTDARQNSYIIPAAIVIAGVLIAGAVLWNQNIAPRPQALPPGAQEMPLPQVDFEGWPSIGNPDAAVTIVEYSDFACPFCKRFNEETKPLIQEQYVDAGKVRFVYKDFVVVGGDRAAEAAHCAAEQGAFWQYQDLLFARQTEDRGRWADVNVHRAYANELGLNADALAECFEERRYREKVLASTQEAQRNGGEGTPFFLVNEIRISGAQPFSVFQEVIERALAGI
jgi:protein-disulfide isomerase